MSSTVISPETYSIPRHCFWIIIPPVPPRKEDLNPAVPVDEPSLIFSLIFSAAFEFPFPLEGLFIWYYLIPEGPLANSKLTFFSQEPLDEDTRSPSQFSDFLLPAPESGFLIGLPWTRIPRVRCELLFQLPLGTDTSLLVILHAPPAEFFVGPLPLSFPILC